MAIHTIDMKLKDLKKILDKLTPEELERPLLYNSEEYSVSGEVQKVHKTKHDLYFLGDDDPSPLYTKSQLKEQGMDNEEIEECEVEIPKGSILIEF